MRVLIACEFSGVVRNAFRALGHEAWSCDLLPAEDGSPHHIQADAVAVANAGCQRRDGRRTYSGEVVREPWDIMLAFPPCTHLASSGARWFPAKRASGEQAAGIAFFMAMVNAPIAAIAVENPIGIMSTLYRKPDQIIQPHHFGHAETKATCLWLKRLPRLVATTPDLKPDFMRKADGTYYTDAKGKRYSRIHFMSGHHGGDNSRSRERSRTYQGIGQAFAAQWGQNQDFPT